MPRRLAQQRMTLSDLECHEWAFYVRQYRLFVRGVLLSMQCVHRLH